MLDWGRHSHYILMVFEYKRNPPGGADHRMDLYSSLFPVEDFGKDKDLLFYFEGRLRYFAVCGEICCLFQYPPLGWAGGLHLHLYSPISKCKPGGNSVTKQIWWDLKSRSKSYQVKLKVNAMGWRQSRLKKRIFKTKTLSGWIRPLSVEKTVRPAGKHRSS